MEVYQASFDDERAEWLVQLVERGLSQTGFKDFTSLELQRLLILIGTARLKTLVPEEVWNDAVRMRPMVETRLTEVQVLHWTMD